MSLVDAVASVLSAGDAGLTAAEIAAALDLPLDGAALQPDLEEMVERGILARCGIGRGALYTLTAPLPTTRMAPLPTTRDASDHSEMGRKGRTSRREG